MPETPAFDPAADAASEQRIPAADGVVTRSWSGDAVSADPAASEPVPTPAGSAREPSPDPEDGTASAADEREFAASVAAEGDTQAGAEGLLAVVVRLETRVTAEVERVLEAFREKLAFDAFREEQVARLHAELQAHRDGLLERATRPLLSAVIRVHDDLGKVVASLRARPAEEITPERTFRVLEGFREDLELLLAQHGVEPFEPVDDVFDPRLHTALRTVHTAAPGQAGRIAERLRPGFSQGEALLQKARVAVFTAQGATRPEPSTTATGEQG